MNTQNPLVRRRIIAGLGFPPLLTSVCLLWFRYDPCRGDCLPMMPVLVWALALGMFAVIGSIGALDVSATRSGKSRALVAFWTYLAVILAVAFYAGMVVLYMRH